MRIEVKERSEVKFKTVFLKKVPPRDKKIEELIFWGKRFRELGITPRTSGNLSLRTHGGFVITGAGTDLGSLRKSGFVMVSKVEVRRDSPIVYAEGKLSPSSESVLHWEIYNQRSEINAIFHLHDERVLEAGEKMCVPCTSKFQLAGTYALACEATKLLDLGSEANYFILKDHGIVSLGKTPGEAGKLVEEMSESAQVGRG